MRQASLYHDPVLKTAIYKTWWRLVPLMFLLYFIAFIDRVNIGFAKDAMNLDIHLSESVYALGAGIFFAAYAMFGIPANLLLNKCGAQKWIGFTTILWGLLSALMGFVTNDTQFLILRFLLGVGEAGFYPGILLLASIYFPSKIRASVISTFVLGVPIALTFGSPLSGALLELHGFWGIAGWTWMFIIEGTLAIIMGIITLFYLDDSPQKARFLTQLEKQTLLKQLQNEDKKTEAHSLKEALTNIKIWHLAIIYGLIQIPAYGMMFFLPSQVANLMGSAVDFKSSLVSSLPWLASAIGVYYLPRLTIKYPQFKITIATLCMICSALGLALSAFTNPFIAIIALCVCATGFLSVQPIFWTFPSQILSGTALAAGIGFCTTMGAICSSIAPVLRVEMDKIMHNHQAGIIIISIIALICAFLIKLLDHSSTNIKPNTIPNPSLSVSLPTD